MTWPLVHLREVLRHVPRPVSLHADALYREIGIRSHGRGIFHKAPVTGAEIGAKRVFQIEPGDFVLNIVFAWEGAIAVASNHEIGMIASHRFPTFRPDPLRLDVRYLAQYLRTRTGLDLLGRVSPGGAGRNRTLNRSAFLEQTISLPPLNEQHHIVARLDVLSAKVEEARHARLRSAAAGEALSRSALASALAGLSPSGVLADVLADKPRNGWSARCDNEDGGVPVLSLSAVTGFQYNPTAFKRTSALTTPTAHYWLAPADLLITRSNTPELVGHVAIYSGSPSPCIYPDLMMRIPLNSGLADTRFAWLWLQTPSVREFIRQRAKGTSPSMKKISQGTVMAIPFPTNVPVETQRELAARLQSVRDTITRLRASQARSASELDALMPAIVDRAFKGAL